MKKNIITVLFVLFVVFNNTIVAQKKAKSISTFVIQNNLNYEISETKVIADSLYVLFVNPNEDGKCGYLDNKINVYSLNNQQLCYANAPQYYSTEKKNYVNSKATVFTVSKKGFVLSSGRNQLLTDTKGNQKTFSVWHNQIEHYKIVRDYTAYPILQIYDNKLLVSVIAYHKEDKKSYSLLALYNIPEIQEKLDSVYKILPNYLIGEEVKTPFKTDLYDSFNKTYTAVSQKNKLIFVANDGNGLISVYENGKFKTTWGELQKNLKPFKPLTNDTIITENKANKNYQYTKINKKRQYEFEYCAYRDMVFDDTHELLYRVYYLPVKKTPNLQNLPIEVVYEKLLEIDNKRVAYLQIFDKTGKKLLDTKIQSNSLLAGVSGDFVYFRQNVSDKLGDFKFYKYKLKNIF